MHVIMVSYEAAAFDVRLTRGGTASMVWGLARTIAASGHQVSVVTPAHGQASHLRTMYGAREIGAPDAHVIPFVPDPKVWADFPRDLRVSTRTFRMRREGVEFYFLANHYLDLLPDTLYPDNEMYGEDIAALKPLVFQVDAIRSIDKHFGDAPAVVQCYDPAFSYLIPPVMQSRPRKTVVSTVVANTRIDDTVYGPQVAAVLQLHGVDIDLSRYIENETDDVLPVAMRNYLRPSHITYDAGPDDVNHFALSADCSHLVDFVSPGQLNYYSTFRDAPFERRFQSLKVSRTVRDSINKFFVGGCGVPDWWFERDLASFDREAVLTQLGLQAERPTFYHAARFAQNHKGQVELFRAIDAVLLEDSEVNFVIRCAVSSAAGSVAVGDPYFQEVADRYPGNVRLYWRMVNEQTLFDHAAAADFCLFPSKFELDGFLIAMAEAMACGAVPIAAAQETLSHYRHTLPLGDSKATGFAVPRSFRANDSIMATCLKNRILDAVRIFREDPDTYRRLSQNSIDLARTFTWERSGAVHLDYFARAQRGDKLEYPYDWAIDNEWYEQIPADVWAARRDRILNVAQSHGDFVTWGRLAAVDETVAAKLFDAAYRRADFARCEQVSHLIDPDLPRSMRNRCEISLIGDECQLHYRYPYADRIDLIVPPGLSRGIGTGNRFTHRLTREDDRFVTVLPAQLVGAELVMLLTLSTGRVAWDLVRPVTSS